MKRILVTCVCLLGAATLASSQMADPPQPGPDHPTLYAHVGSTLWMNTVLEDPDHSGQTHTLMFGDAAASAESVWPLTPQLAEPLALDAMATVDFTINFGCGLVANAGTLTTELRAGGTVIASAEWGPIACPATQGVASYQDYVASVTPTAETVAAGTALEWAIGFEGQGAAFMQTGQSDKHAFVTLPLVAVPGAPAAPAVVNQTLDGETAEVSLNLENVTQTILYAWNTTGEAWNLTHDIALSAGSANLTVVDGNGSVVARESGSMTNGTRSLADARGGNWSITVEMVGATGQIHATIERVTSSESSTPPPPPGSAPSSPPPSDGPDVPAPQNETAQPAQDSPAVPAALFILVLAIAVRRRR